MSTLNTIPQVAGWYWFRANQQSPPKMQRNVWIVLRVTTYSDGLRVRFPQGDYDVEVLGGDWGGLLQPPGSTQLAPTYQHGEVRPARTRLNEPISPIHLLPRESVHTVQSTAKKWKGLMLFGMLGSIGGCGLVLEGFGNPQKPDLAIGAILFVFSGLLYAIGRIGKFWFHE